MADYIPDWLEDKVTKRYLDEIRTCVSCGRYGPLDEWGECENCGGEDDREIIEKR